ncbi:MAG: ATP-binding cassette domain-containing protein, partial [Phycisphaerae bacterium]|nr:ATP-binding cassette domain-containing protein [Phycisphaerae bacterium]
VSVVCVILIAVLWGGGLGMLLPGMKVLIAPEGLHGWAWNTLTEDHLGVKLVRYKVSTDLRKKLHLPPEVIHLSDVKKDSPAAKAGIKTNDWIVGLDKVTVLAHPEDQYIPADALTRTIGLDKADTQLSLLIFNQETDEFRSVTVTLGPVKTSSRILGEIASRIPEPTSYKDRFPILLWLLIIIAAMTILRNGLRFIQEYLVQTAVLQSMMDLRCENYNVALRLPVIFYAASGTTDTMSRFVQDTAELGRAQNTLFGKTLVEPAKAVASIVMALCFSWQLTLIAMVGGPIVYVLIRKFGKVMKRSSRRALESWSDMLGVLEETLTGIRVVKAYTMEAAERKRFFRVNRQLYKQQRRIARINSATSPTVEALGMVAGGAAAGGAGYLVFNGMMDSDTFIAWMACLAAMFDPMRKLSKVATRFQRGDAAAERIFELNRREREKRLPGAPQLPKHSKCIEFRNVDFTYPGTTTPALRDINLTITAGQTIAIVGPNGCGKTTMVSLLPRLLDTTRGEVFIDGCDIASHSLRSLRQQISVVTQETIIFNSSIAENISYGLRRPSHEQVLDAARQAYVDDFVSAMPDGYDTIVGQRGATLSGGQRQRIAIARAILRDPAILIFDEALSQIDPHSEQLISKAMKDFVRNRTTLMIAHRFSSIINADAIVVMDDGAILDVGKHADLLQRCNLYQHLYKTQFANSE